MTLERTKSGPPKMTSSDVFVFGSNLAGRHGAGAARYAYEVLGAKAGVGRGMTGNCYAIPTKDHDVKTMTIPRINPYVVEFINYAMQNPQKRFIITRIGCGLAGYRDSQMAGLFKKAPSNCFFDEAWEPFLPEGKQYWGRFE